MSKTIFLTVLFLSVSLVLANEADLKDALNSMKAGRVEESIAKLEKITLENPADFDAVMALGYAYLDKNDYSASKQALEKALELNPNAVPAYYALAMLSEKQKLNLEALKMWEKVLALSQDKDLKNLAAKHIKQLSK